MPNVEYFRDMTDLVPLLVRRRRDFGWSQRQLAEFAGIHQSTLSGLERALNEPRWPLVRRHCKALGIEVGLLVAYELPPTRQS